MAESKEMLDTEERIEASEVSFVNDRYSKMQAERSKIEPEWLMCEAQVESMIGTDND
jgi:hypothetical protein